MESTFLELQDSHDYPDTPTQDDISQIFASEISVPEIKDLKAVANDLFTR